MFNRYKKPKIGRKKLDEKQIYVKMQETRNYRALR